MALHLLGSMLFCDFVTPITVAASWRYFLLKIWGLLALLAFGLQMACTGSQGPRQLIDPSACVPFLLDYLVGLPDQRHTYIFHMISGLGDLPGISYPCSITDAGRHFLEVLLMRQRLESERALVAVMHGSC